MKNDGSGYKLKVFMNPPDAPTGQVSNYVTATVILLALSVYVAFFSAKKFKRIKM